MEKPTGMPRPSLLMTLNPTPQMLLLASILLFSASDIRAEKDDAEPIPDPEITGNFKLLREPSGVAALSPDTLIVVEDEARHALRRLTPVSDGGDGLTFEEFEQPTANGFLQRQLLGPLDDLEGIARVSATQFIVIGSHEEAERGKWPAREKMILYSLKDDEITDIQKQQNLYDELVRHYPELASLMKRKSKSGRQPLNIEGLALDRKRQRLLVGLRTPLAEDSEAIIIRLDNPLDFLAGENPVFAERLVRLDLDKGGIRALAYDDSSDKLLMVTRRESGNKKRFRLWSVAAADLKNPVPLTSEDKDLFEDVEGLTSTTQGILFVRDGGGDRDDKASDWFILPRDQLGLDTAFAQ